MNWLGRSFGFKRVLSWQAAGLMLVPLLAGVVTWLSGFALTFRSSDGVISQYGLPMFWKTRFEYGGGVGFTGIRRAPFSITTYSMDTFLVDLLLYAGIGYSIILWRWRHISLFMRTVTLVSSVWLAYTTVFFSYSSQYGTWTNGLPVPWTGLWYNGWFYNWIGFAIDVVFIVGLEYFAIFLYRGFRVIVVPGRTPDLPE